MDRAFQAAAGTAGVDVPSLAAMTVRRALELPAVRRGVPEVLAGRRSLDREIRWAHSGEVPNIASLLQGGELLLTTGMGIRPDAAEQRRFVAELDDHGLAALAVELGGSIEAVPPALVKAAEQRGLPLIAFHREVRFVEITEAIHREIIDLGGELLRRGEALHRRFTELLLRGAEVPDVLAELARFVANPVVLERAGHGVAYHAPHRSDDATVLAAWASFARGLEAPAAIAAAVPMGEDEVWGRLVVLATESPPEPGDRVALERAVGLVALALMRDREEEGIGLRERGDFLAGLATSRESERQLGARAAELGFDAAGVALLPLAATPWHGPDPPAAGADWAAARQAIRGELEAHGLPLIAGVRPDDGSLLLVAGLVNRDDRSRIADLVAGAAELAASRQLGDRAAVALCVGPLSESWREAGAGIADAVEALPAAAHAERRRWHDAAAADPDRLLWSLRDRPELRRFAELSLRPLRERDAAGRSQLLPTLAAYCEHGGRKAETARALQIERQSLYHRLARIEEALGVDLSDGATMLSLHLALRAHRYVEPAGGPAAPR